MYDIRNYWNFIDAHALIAHMQKFVYCRRQYRIILKFSDK